MRGKQENLVGRKFGMLTVVSEGMRRHGRKSWVCQCDCGNTCDVITYSLTGGNSTSCGCTRGAAMIKANTKHGLSGTPAYSSWEAMMRRCNIETASDYPRYGGAGIKVCQRWHEFENFVADMGERPPGTTLDRVDGTRGYSPDNCRWATYYEQRVNTKNVRMVKLKGRTMPVSRAARELGVDPGTLRWRIASGMSIDVAVSDMREKGICSRGL